MITPFILGSGRAGHAIANAFSVLRDLHPDWDIAEPRFLARGADLRDARAGAGEAILCIANPHGLHARAILDGAAAGYRAVLCEKPAAVNRREVEALRAVGIPVAVLHGYRQTWGVQTLKEMVARGDFGDLIAIEGRYWQSSTAERALIGGGPTASWKNEVRFSGEYDAYLDIGSHWVDAASFLAGSLPTAIRGWRSFAGAEAPHRDSHVQLRLEFPRTRGFASISKTVHGATNFFEICVLGERASARWEFLNPDEIAIGEGRDRRVLTRRDSTFGSRQPPFHGLGWLEGYVEIASELVREVRGEKREYPSLRESLGLLEAMLSVHWDRGSDS